MQPVKRPPNKRDISPQPKKRVKKNPQDIKIETLKHNIRFLQLHRNFHLDPGLKMWVKVDRATGKWIQLLHEEELPPIYTCLRINLDTQTITEFSFRKSNYTLIQYQFKKDFQFKNDDEWIQHCQNTGSCLTNLGACISVLSLAKILNHAANHRIIEGLEKYPTKEVITLNHVISFSALTHLTKEVKANPGQIAPPHPLQLMLIRTEELLREKGLL